MLGISAFAATARDLAAATPQSRNRVVDLLRAVSIAVVVIGHWTMAAVVTDHGLHAGNILSLAAWTHPFTWLFQVMPVFFLVGGYANALSWRSARRRGVGYGAWLRGRARRLALPVIPVLVFWLVVGWVALRLGMDWHTVRLASTVSLMPTWFLAAYIVVTAVAPAALWLWERWRWWSLAAGLALASAVDAGSLASGSVLAGFINYLLVWGTVHQLGFAWLDGALASFRSRIALGLTGLCGMLALVTYGPYPVSMVGVDTSTVNNTYPPRVTLLLLGMFQAGALLLLEAPAERAMRHLRAWTVVVAMNLRIMTLYLWHVTAMVMIIAFSLLLGGAGLTLTPLTTRWWLTRPVWYLALGALTVVLVALLGRFETPAADTRPPPPWWRPLLAVTGVCAGLGSLAIAGVASAHGLNWALLLVPVISVYAGGVARAPRAKARHRNGRPPPSPTIHSAGRRARPPKPRTAR
jgi:peptidoglycan/LPS O-acetylase OafA/YrhL